MTCRAVAPEYPRSRVQDKTSHYGYKNHVNVDRKHKLIRRYHVTDAALHDSQAVDHLLTRGNTGSGVWADAAYRSEETEVKLRARQLTGSHAFKLHILLCGRENSQKSMCPCVNGASPAIPLRISVTPQARYTRTPVPLPIMRFQPHGSVPSARLCPSCC